MEADKLDEILSAAVQRLRSEEQKWIEQFYARPVDSIRSSETSELPARCISFPVRAQEEVTQALRAADVPYVNTIWRNVSEELPSFDYVYINWDSVDSWSNPMKDGDSRYRVNVTQDEYARAQKAFRGGDDPSFDAPKNNWLPPAVGAAAAGTVILLGLILPGHSVLLVPALVVGLAAGAGIRLIRPAAEEPRPGLPSRAAGSGAAERDKAVRIAVSAARSQNMKIVEDWCGQLRTAALRVCREKST